MTAGLILVGEFGRPHGVRGLVKLRAYTADPDAVAAYGPLTDEAGARRFRLELLPGGIARVDGVADRDGAARLTGLRLYVSRDALPPTEPDEFYLADLVGLRAVAADGAALGRVAAVDDFGAGAFLTLRDDRGGEAEVPFTRACVPAVDVAGGTLTISPPDEVLVVDAAEDAGHPADRPDREHRGSERRGDAA